MLLRMNKNVIEKFLQYLLIELRYPKNTVIAYENDLKQLEALCAPEGNGSLGDWWKKFNSANIKMYKIHLKNKEYLPSTINRKLASMKSFFLFLNDQDLINTNPTQNIKLDKFGTNRAPEYLTLEEAKELINACSGDNYMQIRNKAMVGLLYSSGLRVTELVSLNIIDINLKDGWVRCNGKGSKERLVPIYRSALVDLELYLTESRPILKTKFTKDSLFVNARGKRMTRQECWRVLKEVTNNAGIEKSVSPHTLRHTFATHLLQGGANLLYVKELLGHSNIDTTQVYTHLSSEFVRDGFHKSAKGPAR